MRHDRAAGCFELGNGEGRSVLEYRLVDNRMDIYHTEVPPSLRGQGVAQKLAHAALEWAQEEGFTVIPTCSYIAAYIQRNQQYQSLLD